MRSVLASVSVLIIFIQIHLKVTFCIDEFRDFDFTDFKVGGIEVDAHLSASRGFVFLVPLRNHI